MTAVIYCNKQKIKKAERVTPGVAARDRRDSEIDDA